MAWPQTEATLDELLEEPITQLLMRRDGVSEAEIRRLIAACAQSRSGRRPPLGQSMPPDAGAPTLH